MTDINTAKNLVLDEIINRGKLGDKKFHSETSLQQFGEDQSPDILETPTEEDPGVHNESVGNGSSSEDHPARRRTMSQPGPVSGNLVTATAARAARRRPQRNVMYHPDIERSDSANERQSPRILMAGNLREDTGSLTPIGDRASPLSYNGNLRNGDAKSLNSYRLYMPQSDARGSATPRKRSVATMDAQSIRSTETHAPPPTDPEENKKQTKRYLTLIISCMYAILLVTLGIIIYLGDSFVDLQISEVYSIILCGIGMIYIGYLIFDINRYKSIAVKNHKIKAQHEQNVLENFRKEEERLGSVTPGDRTPDSFRFPRVPPPVLIPNKHEYCFSQGRHSGSFYLKMGAAGFALGHLVHSLLLLAVQIGQLMDENVDNDECVKIMQVVLDVMLPAYCFLQLYFIFKYSNVIILKAQGLAHIAFMHLIGSSLCFWISAIVRETVLSLTLYASSRENGQGYSNDFDDHPVSNYALSIDERFINISNLYNPNCKNTAAISSIYENFSPYLYPFNVEFNILIVAIYYIIWSNIGNCDNEENSSDTNSTSDDNYHLCKIPTANEDNDFTSNIVIYADCHASNRGLFLGLIVMVIITGMLIIGFVFSSVGDDSENFVEVGYFLNSVTRLGLHILLLFAAVIAWFQMRQLDINEHPISLLDDVLLFICLPAFFMETVFSLVATITYTNIVKIIDFVVMVVQVLIQTPLIMDGLRRCSNTKKLRRKKPGREVLMFLLTANVAMWIFNTFSYKSPESLDERYEYYGKVMWSILGHISLPLIMFYRFHSSVCFADIWDSAYKPGLEH
ncbi:unnamed protein product [Chrysodeixis includens]|uniref:Proton channel OtopLc-like n=1 Tax=Chrysodeixis includens TaxID=689277 RepID=A0A9P0C272_CHRIL|nr:unnamed protein product [Chrysodeixis includens]